MAGQREVKKERAPWNLRVHIRSVREVETKTLGRGSTLVLTDTESGDPVLRIKYLGKKGIEVTQLCPFLPVNAAVWRAWADHVEREAAG